MINNATGTVLNSQTLSSFQNGVYLVWNVSGSITIRVTNLNSAADAVISGLFLGGPLAPTVATPASAGPNPVTGTSTALSVLGADANYPALNLTYTWAATSVPRRRSTPTFSVNGTNAAQNTTATFSQAGSYTFGVTIADPSGETTTASVTVTVTQTLTAITVTPAIAAVPDSATQLFSATATDQFGQALTAQPTITWSVDAGGAGGTIAASGLYTGPAAGIGSATVRATSGAVSGTAAVSVIPPGTIIDDLQRGYSETGSGWSTSTGAGFDNELRYRASTDPSTATWLATGLAAGYYDVQATWNADPNHATNTPYDIKVNGTVVGSFTVNQMIAPTGTLINGVAFQTLMTSVQVPAGGTIELDLAGPANGYVIADAARFVPSTAPTVDLNWSGGGLTGVPANETAGIPFTVVRTYTIAGGTVSTNFTIGYYASTSPTFDSTAVLLASETINASGGLAPGNYTGTSPSIELPQRRYLLPLRRRR